MGQSANQQTAFFYEGGGGGEFLCIFKQNKFPGTAADVIKIEYTVVYTYRGCTPYILENSYGMQFRPLFRYLETVNSHVESPYSASIRVPPFCHQDHVLYECFGSK